jgi:flagellar basal-body rod protein FlgG
MDLSFAIAQNGLHVGNIRQAVIANNLSNLTTDAFRAQLVDPATVTGPGTQVLGVRDSTQLGSPRQTSAQTDLYLAGEGFFRIETPDGTAYTRNGRFAIDADGNLVTGSGHFLDPQIVVPEESVALRVEPDGTVESIDADGIVTELGQIEITRFINPAGLIAIGDNLYVEGPNSGDPLAGTAGEDGFARIAQFAIEESTVDPSREITNQIVNQRYYQLNLRSFQTSDAIVSRTLDIFS